LVYGCVPPRTDATLQCTVASFGEGTRPPGSPFACCSSTVLRTSPRQRNAPWPHPSPWTAPQRLRAPWASCSPQRRKWKWMWPHLLLLLFAISDRMLVEDAAGAQFVAAARLLRSHRVCRASLRLLAEAWTVLAQAMLRHKRSKPRRHQLSKHRRRPLMKWLPSPWSQCRRHCLRHHRASGVISARSSHRSRTHWSTPTHCLRPHRPKWRFPAAPSTRGTSPRRLLHRSSP